MLKKGLFYAAALLSLMSVGCSSQDIPPAHKGRMFDKTGPLALYAGGKGFEGPVLNPGTYFTGLYPEVRMIECGQRTIKEQMNALTKDGVQFSLDIYIAFSAFCDEEKSVIELFNKLSPEGHQKSDDKDKSESTGGKSADPNLTITADQVYRVYVRPALGEAVRENVSPFIANDINANRDEIFGKIKETLEASLKKHEPKIVVIYTLNLSNLDFPDALDQANAARAVQAILKDQSIAKQETLKVEIETAKLEVLKADVEAQATAKKIDVKGAAYERNPKYWLADVYYYAAQFGGSTMVPTDPNVLLQMVPKPAKGGK